MSYEDVECQRCGSIGLNMIEEHVPVRGHPNVEEKWLICDCGHAIKEIEE